MVTFVTLFLGLVIGSHPVQLAVSGPVDAVILELDGVAVATLRDEPWVAETDLGDQLQPHELVAIALDANGQELGRSDGRMMQSAPISIPL